ncbi:MAG: enoyl-CoA hydratase/isomerase family protein [Solirubrobacteraceae bacterium]
MRGHIFADPGTPLPRAHGERYCPATTMALLDQETIDCRRADGIARLRLNRPDALNAWTPKLGSELLDTLDDVATDPAVRVVVITGAGRAFSSGADLRAGLGPGDGAVPDVLTTLREIYNPLLLHVRTLPKPVIAAVNGPAVGIGCSLALACDLIVAAQSAYFLMAFANIGLSLDGGASQTLLARVGHARAFEIACLGERVSADQALDWGLINRTVPDSELESEVTALATRLAAGPPGSYANIKRTINERAYTGFAEILDLEAVLQQERTATKDFAEGVTAFLQKRPARFTGE